MAKKEARKAREAEERRLSGAPVPVVAPAAVPATAASARPGKVKKPKASTDGGPAVA